MSSTRNKDGQIEDIGDDWELLFPGEYLRGIDIAGARPTVKIERLYRKTIRGKKHPIAELKGKDRKWRINFTNGFCLATMFGPNPKGWIGRRVTLCTENVRAFGKPPAPAIRVYGSPEIDREIEVYKDLQDHGEIRRVMRPTGKRADPPSDPAPAEPTQGREPGSDG